MSSYHSGDSTKVRLLFCCCLLGRLKEGARWPRLLASEICSGREIKLVALLLSLFVEGFYAQMKVIRLSAVG